MRLDEIVWPIFLPALEMFGARLHYLRKTRDIDYSCGTANEYATRQAFPE